MIDPASLRAIDAVTQGGSITRPLYESYCFAGIPATVKWLLTGRGYPTIPVPDGTFLEPPNQAVVLLLIDGFGWEFMLELADESPFLTRILRDGIAQVLTTQFPATTASHMPTLHFGIPVAEHGIYEWNMYEPGVGGVIAPLMFSFAGDTGRDTLAAQGVDPAELFPFGTIYQWLGSHGVRSHAHLSANYSNSPFSSSCFRGAEVHGFSDIDECLENVVRTSRSPSYSVAYIDEVDRAGHIYGPRSEQALSAGRDLLSKLERKLLRGLAQNTLIVMSADHGQIAMHPEACIYLNEVFPWLKGHVATHKRGIPDAPSGGARDLFLHLERPGEAADLAARLQNDLDAAATVLTVHEVIDRKLFGEEVSTRLRERLGDVVILPDAGTEVGWRAPGLRQTFLGHHGGLTRKEALTYAAFFRV
ncbi:MAG TPA: nucleotide pyrophosphatase/phosphodiesterase family protein [Streptosporangiaceae bacterium]|nr:nucleotide pyrophosphatase/phosphodiesterase family protein [Streptosporangiaceae bacterium]